MQQEFVTKKSYYTSPTELCYECNTKKTHTLYAQLQKIGRDIMLISTLQVTL